MYVLYNGMSYYLDFLASVPWLQRVIESGSMKKKKCNWLFEIEIEIEWLNICKFEYIRSEGVMPYNPALLIAWNAHCNVQYVTDLNIAEYLVKYISKAEPTF